MFSKVYAWLELNVIEYSLIKFRPRQQIAKGAFSRTTVYVYKMERISSWSRHGTLTENIIYSK